jgi:hypothetical protein
MTHASAGIICTMDKFSDFIDTGKASKRPSPSGDESATSASKRIFSQHAANDASSATLVSPLHLVVPEGHYQDNSFRDNHNSLGLGGHPVPEETDYMEVCVDQDPAGESEQTPTWSQEVDHVPSNEDTIVPIPTYGALPSSSNVATNAAQYDACFGVVGLLPDELYLEVTHNFQDNNDCHVVIQQNSAGIACPSQHHYLWRHAQALIPRFQ